MRSLFMTFAIAALSVFAVTAQTVAPAPRFHAAIASGELAWRLSEPEEVKALLGTPLTDETRRDGGMEVRLWTYAGEFGVAFARESGTSSAFVLWMAKDGNRELGLPPGQRLVLRTTADLAKLRPFTGVQNIDLSRLDLRNEDTRVRELTFDTRTVWPPADRMPKGFDPASILNEGRNPGLGVRALHARGIDGRGVTIAIIDQPLLPEHAELKGGRLQVIAEIDVQGRPPQMHGPAVSSLAAGKSVGVAPAANLAYVSMAMWKSAQGNDMYVQAVERILELNRQRDAGSRIRAVSISYGGFRTAPKADEWQSTLAKAEAEGLLVVTCDFAGSKLDYGMLKPLAGGDREKPDGYGRGTYGAASGVLVPADGRTYAHNEGANDYIYAPTGGLSWAAPYIVGLAALAYQVNPALTPAQVRAYLVRTATKMPYGSVVNPAAFVQMCRDNPDDRK